MRPTEFNAEDVIAAGNTLLESGRKITGFALRQSIGNGTPALLKQVWDNHISNKHIERAAPTIELPSTVAESLVKITTAQAEQLTRFVKELNTAAVTAAESRIEALLKEQAEKDKQTEEELTEALIAYEKLEAKLNEEITKSTLLDQQLTQALADLMQGREIAAKLSGQLEAITTENTKLLSMLKPKK